MQLILFNNHKVASATLSAGGFDQTSGEEHKVQVNISGQFYFVGCIMSLRSFSGYSLSLELQSCANKIFIQFYSIAFLG